MMKHFRNKKGMSIVEVLVAAGLTTVVSLGIATMIQNSMLEQKKTVLLATLRENKIRIETMLRDQQAWTYTLGDATNLALTPANQSTTCLRNTATCADMRLVTPQKLVVRDAANNVAYNLLTWAGAGTSGFTESGAACNTFSSTTGTDQCPISYRLVYIYICPGTASAGLTCVNPQVKIVGRLIFNPAATGYLNRFRGLVDVGDLTSIVNEGMPHDGRYDIVVKRTAVQTNRQFRLVMRYTGTAGSCTSAGAGVCTTAFSVYPTSGGAGRGAWATGAAEDDPDNLVTLSGSNFTFTANNGGPYSCMLNAQAFSTDSFSVQLYNSSTTTEIATGTTTAGLWAMSNAIAEAKFIAVPGQTYTVRQRCQTVPGGTPSAAGCSLGMAQSYGVPTDYVSLSCYKSDM